MASPTGATKRSPGKFSDLGEPSDDPQRSEEWRTETPEDELPLEDELKNGTYDGLLRALDAATDFKRANHLDRESFSKDCTRLRLRMRRTRKGLINPRSRFMTYWDLVTAIALLFTATVTPFEVGLGLPTKVNALFVVNQTINVVFFIDVFVQFFLPVPDAKTGELLRDRREIARRYLTSWFVIDIVSILPMDIVEVTGMLGDGNSGLRSVRLFRVLRLAKLCVAQRPAPRSVCPPPSRR